MCIGSGRGARRDEKITLAKDSSVARGREVGSETKKNRQWPEVSSRLADNNKTGKMIHFKSGRVIFSLCAPTVMNIW